jgi:hypothetical protein
MPATYPWPHGWVSRQTQTEGPLDELELFLLDAAATGTKRPDPLRQQLLDHFQKGNVGLKSFKPKLFNPPPKPSMWDILKDEP